MKNKILKTARDVALKVFNFARRHPVASVLIVALVIAYLVKPWLVPVVIGVAVALAWFRYSGEIRRLK